ncbi:ArfGap-domain-containing protein [Artomyces pyxidatus]|uniref:ArfGap-domain-containing protein n=1 Tax=Artomyces pyxidatus TaxID=48021 RepID=A0ACB8T3J5_9AGAM|nr:ArfGap-domain-containing protein [Artomyces pyxidatus]
MSRQDKATTERNARTLRDLIKKPENRVCADCKHNDPRWASWNLGVYLCIRCSGIHRGMGTHISKVKSIDLDTWTPEQMEVRTVTFICSVDAHVHAFQTIQKWGNRLANLYWEAHLKPGHIPPDHKMESFIRSKYESRRWAMDGLPPSDPSVLDGGAAQSSAPEPTPAPLPAPTSSVRSAHAPNNSLSARRPASPAVTPQVTNRQPQPHQLLSAQHMRGQNAPRATSSLAATPQTQPQAAAPPAQPKAPENDLFSLDFHAPPVASANTSAAPRKDVKQDILSLFSTPAQPPQPQAAFGAFAAAPAASPWGQPTAAQFQQPAAPFANTNPSGVPSSAAWNVGHAWNAPAATPVPPAQGNIWGGSAPAAAPQAQVLLGSGGDIWGGSASSGGMGGGDLFGASAPATAAPPKKDDVFGDIWGGFK